MQHLNCDKETFSRLVVLLLTVAILECKMVAAYRWLDINLDLVQRVLVDIAENLDYVATLVFFLCVTLDVGMMKVRRHQRRNRTYFALDDYKGQL